ncbi:hypothetical protein C8J42_10281 [Sphingomonas sp. PP-CE-1A-559]|nr:hypothetical protein [Sphingomonas sp. PP-CE-1A-559]TCP92316.1 hypothetical protein C8J42_10281 [Sphingomonas sp. PP-CE-1A-559]
MSTLSQLPSVPLTKTRATPPVVHGLAYGIFASIAMWGAIATVAYNVF